MNMTAKTRYACLAMVELASQWGLDRPVSIREIAQRHDAPSQFLVQILIQLKRAGLIHSIRGATGGYMLAHPPDEITLGRVCAAMDGLASDETSPDASPTGQALARAWQRANEQHRKALDATTLSDLLDEIHGRAGRMYYI